MLRAIILGFLLLPAWVRGQAPSAKAAAPFDLTGYWASLITQNWRFRMITPAKGDYLGIPVTPEGKRVADAWDPAKDEASGNSCKAYGAAGIMQLPGRLRFTWQDDNTLRLEIDNGNQTRILRFGNAPSAGGKPSLQGDSVAAWTARRGPGLPPSTPRARYLKVTTTHMTPGYLRKNGVPYSENAALTEYYDFLEEPNGDALLVVTTVVEDPVYLQNPLILSTHFKKQRDGAGWSPEPCSAK